MQVEARHRRRPPGLVRRQRTPANQAGALHPIDIAGMEGRIPTWYPKPPQGVVLHPAAVVVRQPTPGIGADPGVAEAVVPSPLSISERNPAFRYFRSPNRTVFRRLDPGTSRAEIGKTVMRCSELRGRSHSGQVFVALFVPMVGVKWSDLIVKVEPAGSLWPHAYRPSFFEVQFGGGRREAHRALQHRNLAPFVAGFQADARLAINRNLRSRHGEQQRVAAFGATGEIGDAAVERDYCDSLPRGQTRVIGKLAQRITTKTDRGAFVKLDFQPGLRPGTEPGGLGERKVAQRRPP